MGDMTENAIEFMGETDKTPTETIKLLRETRKGITRETTKFMKVPDKTLTETIKL
eukprot:CAMPEP_0174265864 /NCGR_PEP_ID=MMETSP0439-20130205/28212_1 /TAXON_ID=0 /ORGANISM="Stereomyxa ramosa, Strain Chinc5" /LENGTH=54 /DNA_ID=CAMNT_0015352535 /DNA_START=177 /DNA_END=337 /DNA_ORIENTATION=+